jgi:ubiquitin-protein ligase
MKVALPRDILRKRMKNEIRLVRDQTSFIVEVEDAEFWSFPATIYVTFNNVQGPVLKGNEVHYNNTHKIKIEIPKEYPYQKPTARFLTDIFHPNIVPPKRGGWVCIKLLDNWDFSSNLMTFLLGLRRLLTHPNPESPYKDETTILAARYFLKCPIHPPVKLMNEPLKSV